MSNYIKLILLLTFLCLTLAAKTTEIPLQDDYVLPIPHSGCPLKDNLKKPAVIWPHRHDKQRYWVCRKGLAYPMKCPEDQEFDATYFKCSNLSNNVQS